MGRHAWELLTRRRVSAVITVLGLVANVLRILHVTSGATPRVLAVGYAAAGISYALRWVSHLVFFCLQKVGPELKVKVKNGLGAKLRRDLTGDERKAVQNLRCWVGGELVAMASWLFTAWEAIRTGSSLLLCSACAITFFGMMLLVTPVEDARAETPLESASWYVEHCGFGQRILAGFQDLGQYWAWGAVGDGPDRGAKRRASSCVIVTWVAVGAIGVGSAYGAVEQLVHHATPSPRHVTAGKSGYGSQHPGIGRSAGASSTITSQPSSSTGQSGVAGESACQSAGGIPQSQRDQLNEAISALGLTASGEVSAAQSVSGRCGTWVEEGTCVGTPWSLTVAPPGEPAETLIGTQATNVGRQFVTSHSLLAITTRLTLSSGDAYGIQTTGGTYILIRQHSATRALKSPPRTCSLVPATAGLYQEMPPQLAGLWLTLAQTVFTWPVKTGSTATDSSWKFLSDEPHSRRIAKGGCSLAGCWITETGGTPITPTIESSPAALERLANEEEPP